MLRYFSALKRGGYTFLVKKGIMKNLLRRDDDCTGY